jgi:hypothetical protein
VHGTIEVPEDKFRNWAGGFQHIEAAMDFASAGGIPLTAATAAGRITKVRMEHIWVEAAVDFHPSRGVKNLVADSWVGMDPSFKQIEVLPGLDAVQIARVDVEALVASYRASGTVNESEGWVAGFNTAILQNSFASSRDALDEYMNDLPPDTRVADILGGERIARVETPMLPAGLPARLVYTGAQYASLPAALKQEITFAFGKDIEGQPIDPHTFGWSTLNNRAVTLSFRPATSTDEDALRALLPPEDIDPSQFPTTIPGYLVNVVPELRVENQILMSGLPMRLGEELNFVFNAKFAGRGDRAFSYWLPAGSYLTVAVTGGSIAPKAIMSADSRVSQTIAALESAGDGSAAALTRNDILGHAYYAQMLDYFGRYSVQGEFNAAKQRGHFVLAAGLGTFGYEPKVDSFLGIPRAILTGTNVLNVPIVNIVGHTEMSVHKRRDITLQLGFMASALEHAVPERGAEDSGDAASAVKAFHKAVLQGERVLAANQSNVHTVLAQTQLDANAGAEVLNAVRAGATAVLHTGRVAVPGWNGVGYIILDPLTGSGAYKISGGANGGVGQLGDAISVTAAGSAGYLDTSVGRYADREFWFSERLKYLSNAGKVANGLGYLGFAISAYLIWTDETLSTSEQLTKTFVEMLFFGISGYMTSAITAAALTPVGLPALSLTVALSLSVGLCVALSYAYIMIQAYYFAAVFPHQRDRRMAWCSGCSLRFPGLH